MEISFQAVVDRLVAACAFDSETALAQALGFKQSVFAMRKTRNSLPRAEIDAFVQARGLNPEWVYEGTGSRVVDKGLSHKIKEQNKIHARLEPFALNQRQRTYMARLLLALELEEELRLKELLDEQPQFTDAEARVVMGLRVAPPELATAIQHLAASAIKLKEREAGLTGVVAATRMSAIPDPETARMKPAEKRRYEAAKKGKAAK